MKKNILLICHSNFLPNGEIFDSHWAKTFGFLEKFFKNDYTLIRHSLYKNGPSRIYKDGSKEEYVSINFVKFLPVLLRYVFEIIFNFLYLIRSNLFKKEYRIFIGVDPLSCFAGCLFKKVGFKLKVFFISPDFARVRFSNYLVNKIYYFIDKFCTVNSDYNLCASITTINYKKHIYNLSDNFRKLVHYPSTPPIDMVNLYNKLEKVKFQIIYVGIIDEQINFIKLINIIAFQMRGIFPDIKLIIVGDGTEKKKLEKYIKDNNIRNVILKGKLKYNETMREVAKSEIGIALYNGNLSYDEFRDSCKIREYQAYRTIPITSNVVRSNAEEIEKFGSGILIKDESQLASAIQFVYKENNLENLKHGCVKNNTAIPDKYKIFHELINTQ